LEANIHLVRNFIFHNPTMQYFLDYLNTINSYKEHHEIAEGIVAEDGHQKPDLALLGKFFFRLQKGKKRGEKNVLFAVRLLEPLSQAKPLEHLGESEAAKNVPDDTAQAKGVQLK